MNVHLKRQVVTCTVGLVAALLLLGAHGVRAGELDAMAPDLFAHYSKRRLKTLAATVHSAKKVAEEFDERCRTNPDATQRKSDCEVGQKTHQHLDELMTEELELMSHLRRDGEAAHSWVSLEDHVFWEEVGGSSPRSR